MHAATFLQDLAVVMIVAGLVTVVFHRFKQPVVLGYILAGIIIGPHTPPFPLISNKEAIDTLAELGVILLMFSIGLEFSLRKISRVGGAAIIGALLEILVMLWIGYEIGRLFGWATMDRIFLGAMLSISSTVIIAKSLADLGKTKEPFAQVIFGILIVEDVLAIVMIALLSGVAITGTLKLAAIGVSIVKVSIFLVAALVVGFITMPRLIGYVARFKRNEMLLITVLGLCFGFSLLAAKLGFSVALGAFIVGVVIAESREIHRITVLTEPVRDMFSAVFFVAIGLLIDPAVLVQHWAAVLVITIAVVVGQCLTCALGTFLAGNDLRTSLRVGLGLAQIGEFSFIIAGLGTSLNVTSSFLYPVAVAVSAVTTLFNPYLIRNADRLVGWFDRVAPRKVVNCLALYTQWVGQFGSHRHASLARKLQRRWFGQMALNLVLVAAVFAGAAYISKRPPTRLQQLPFEPDTIKAALWLSAMLVSLPLLIATFRKLQAYGLLISETRVSPEKAGERTAAIRAVVAQGVGIAGVVLMSLYVLALSSTLLPSLEILLILILILALVTWLLWRSFVKIYSHAQFALRETLSQEPPPTAAVAPAQQAALLREVNLETVEILPDASAAGKLIRELEVRTRTGASIVVIERRSGERLINPGPDEELRSGDNVVLLGTTAQLSSARLMFSRRG